MQMKKFFSALLAVLLAFQVGLAAAAAPANSQTAQAPYSIQVIDGKLLFLRGGVVVREVALANSEIRLTRSQMGGIAVQVVEAPGQTRRFSLESQTTLAVSGQMSSLILTAQLPKQAQISLGEQSRVSLLNVNAPVQVSLHGQASNLRISDAGARVNAAQGSSVGKVSTVSRSAVNGVSAGKVSVVSSSSASSSDSSSDDRPSGGSSSSGSSSSGSGSSGGSSTQSYSIERVEASNMRVKVTLNRATSRPLQKSAFAILCNGSGKDMTILEVSTQDNRVYDLRTTSYDDNTYFLSIQLPDGSLINKTFVTSLLGPEINSVEATRVDETTAQFSFASDTAGSLYYLVQKKASTRARTAFWNGSGEPTIAQVKQQGERVSIQQGANEVTVSQLVSGASYVIYFVAEDGEGNTTPLKYADIPATPAGGTQGDYKIEKIRAFSDMSGFFQEHNWFEVRLNKPTASPLSVSNFKVTCPAQSDSEVGRVTTEDNQTYMVYIKENTILKDKNTFTITVSFADGTTASGKIYLDFTEPELTGYTVKRTGATTAEVQFRSNKPGTLYWKVMDGNQVPWDTVEPKDPDQVVNGGETFALKATGNLLTIDVPEAGSDKLFFCCVPEDETGNRSSYYYYWEIPAEITDSGSNPDPAPGGDFEIVSIVPKLGSNGKYTLTVTFAKALSVIPYGDDVTVSGNGLNLNGSYDLAVNSTYDLTVIEIVLKAELDPGEYNLTIEMFGEDENGDIVPVGTAAGTFTVGDEEVVASAKANQDEDAAGPEDEPVSDEANTSNNTPDDKAVADESNTPNDEAAADENNAPNDEAAADENSAPNDEAAADENSAPNDEAAADENNAPEDAIVPDESSTSDNETGSDENNAPEGETTPDEGNTAN